MKNQKKLTSEEQEEFIQLLKSRFDNNMQRHKNLEWIKVQEKLEVKPEKVLSLHEMERTGGEPDIVGYDEKADEFVFYDCSAESPKGRRSLCYDQEALESRKKFKPDNNAVAMAEEMGVELLTEEEYKELQKLGRFDSKTSSWLKTPAEVRELGGAIFGDWRFGRVFIYHNGAESYYGSRGFRGSLKV